jgi:hypothetical protein
MEFTNSVLFRSNCRFLFQEIAAFAASCMTVIRAHPIAQMYLSRFDTN